MSLKNKPRRKSSSGEIFIIMIISYDPDWNHLSLYFGTRGDTNHYGKDDVAAQAERVWWSRKTGSLHTTS